MIWQTYLKRWLPSVIALVAIATTWTSIRIVPGIYIDIGGALIPALLALAGLTFLRREITSTIFLFVVMVVVFHFLSTQNSHGVEVAMWAGSLFAGIASVGVSRQRAGLVAYVVSTLGVLVGADFLHSFPMGSNAIIGGAGVADVVLLVGPLAAVFAAGARKWLP